MAEPKTKPTGEDVESFLNAMSDESKRRDCFTLLEMMKQITKLEPKIWASSMVGFGDYHYKYASGHEGDAFIVGFSPRKQNLTIYILTGFEGEQHLLGKLGKHKIGKGCLYINKLDDLHLPTLHSLIQHSVELMLQNHPQNQSKA